MIARKFIAENTVEHTVILKINKKPLTVQKGKKEEFEYIEGKDDLLYPSGHLKIYPLDSEDGNKGEKVEAEKYESESEPKVTEKKETVAQAKAKNTRLKRAGAKAKDVTIETEEK